jgi:hypothetical protein
MIYEYLLKEKCDMGNNISVEEISGVLNTNPVVVI